MLKCPSCGNADFYEFGCYDKPTAIRGMVKIDEDGTLLVTSSYEIEYTMEEESQLHIECFKCSTVFDPPMKVEHV